MIIQQTLHILIIQLFTKLTIYFVLGTVCEEIMNFYLDHPTKESFPFTDTYIWTDNNPTNFSVESSSAHLDESCVLGNHNQTRQAWVLHKYA